MVTVTGPVKNGRFTVTVLIQNRFRQVFDTPDGPLVFPRNCVGVRHEWHLVFLNSFQHISFGLISGFHEEEILLVPPFS